MNNENGLNDAFGGGKHIRDQGNPSRGRTPYENIDDFYLSAFDKVMILAFIVALLGLMACAAWALRPVMRFVLNLFGADI